MLAAASRHSVNYVILLRPLCPPAASRPAYELRLRALKKKAAEAALVFEDRNGPTSSQKAVPEADKAY